ncbi:MAG: hypothetical protein ACYS1A_16365 [Planctomycetota bacterium]|jgi:hypothetical protein
MKSIIAIFCLCLVLAEAGCESVSLLTKTQSRSEKNVDESSVYARYTPAKIEIMPLTEIVYTDDAEEESKIIVYVSLLDSFGCQGKMPGVFRFELYERVVRSAEPKGRRVVIWPDIDLTKAVENNEYWRDFLRVYEFNLPFEAQINQCYILQVTYLCPSGKRLSAELSLKCVG